MRPKRIILVRHGQSEGQVDPEAYATIPDHKIALTDLGRNQAMWAGMRVKEVCGTKPSLITYCSPHLRSVQTLDAMHVATGKVYQDPRLREQEWGNFHSAAETAKAQEERYRYGPFYYRFPSGESGADAYDRVSAFLETMHRDFEKDDYPENALIVSHGMTIRLFVMRWFHVSVDEFESWPNPGNCSVHIMELQDRCRYGMPDMKGKP